MGGFFAKKILIVRAGRNYQNKRMNEESSDATEKYDCNEKMDIYRKVDISEYWIVDWRKKQVEIYIFDWKDDDTSCAYLFKKVTELPFEISPFLIFLLLNANKKTSI